MCRFRYGWVTSYCLLCDLQELLHFISSIFHADCFDSLGAFCNGRRYFVCMIDGGVSDVHVAELCRVSEAFTTSGLDVAQVRTIVFRQIGEVPTVN